MIPGTIAARRTDMLGASGGTQSMATPWVGPIQSVPGHQTFKVNAPMFCANTRNHCVGMSVQHQCSLQPRCPSQLVRDAARLEKLESKWPEGCRSCAGFQSLPSASNQHRG